ncbi:UNVERIFIED_CONTAM: hypothetical protein GTU68_049080 [Idotea baltica]|nr:hypothetical protein [Idotea baltica]
MPLPTGGLVLPEPFAWAQAKARHVLIDPSTALAWATLPIGDKGDVDLAVTRARAFADQEWERPNKAKRLDILGRLIRAIDHHREEFAQRISKEMGAPIDFARQKQVGTALDHLEAYRQAAEEQDDQTPDPSHPEHRVRCEPLGVAALITPWNWPLNQVVLKVGAALVAGCSMVLKPSEYASTSALLFADCMHAAGADVGQFQLLLGEGSVGQMLCAHPLVDVISFTGSTQTGASIASVAAPQFKRLNLELGGKSANILFADCALPLAVEQGLAHAFRNTGQSCNAASRMLIDQDIYEKTRLLSARMADAFAVRSPAEEGDHLGALVNERQYRKVQHLIQQAIDQGARVIAGGVGRPDGMRDGYFVRPTVLADVTEDMTIFHEEVFGPVLTLTPFEGEAEAVRLANATRYGLAGYVQTEDGARADRMARQLQVGMVQVNGSSRAAGAPFGGRRASGQGREAGLWGIRAFQDVKSVSGVAREDDATA